MTQSIFQAQPFELPFDPRTTALVMIDMQRDFVEAGGFGEALGNDVSRYARLSHHVQRCWQPHVKKELWLFILVKAIVQT